MSVSGRGNFYGEGVGDGYACGTGRPSGYGYGTGVGEGTGGILCNGSCEGAIDDSEHGWGHGDGYVSGGGDIEGSEFCGDSRYSEYRGDCAVKFDTIYYIGSQVIETRFENHVDYRFTREEAESALAIKLIGGEEQ